MDKKRLTVGFVQAVTARPMELICLFPVSEPEGL
jgi:hypothetical protein